MAPTEKQIADTIRAIKTQQKISDTELSLATGIPHNTLKRRITTGRGMKLDEVAAIAEALGMDPLELQREARDASKAVAA